MNNIVLYDRESFEIIENLNIGSGKNNIKFLSIEKFFSDFLEINDIYITLDNNKLNLCNNFLSIENNIFIISTFKSFFISEEVLSIINFCNKNKINLDANIILNKYEKVSSDILISWLCKINETYNMRLRVTLEVLNKDILKLENYFSNLLQDNEERITKVINNSKQVKMFDEIEMEDNISKDLIKNKITIYTDGACSGNPGAGGWGAVLINESNGYKKEISGFDALTTNNKMELLAVIKALSMLKQRCSVELYSDSAYVVNAINQSWLENWKKNGWKGSDKKPVKNIELWQELDKLINYHLVKFIKVKGHADNELNNRCDKLATDEIAKHS